MPGMRLLAEAKCPDCSRDYYVDLPASHGLFYPMVLERDTGIVHDEHDVAFFADWLRETYEDRRVEPVPVEVETNSSITDPLIINCIDTLYGHCLLKLLNTQRYLDNYPEKDLLVLVPAFMRWLVPDGVAEVWTVDWSLEQGVQWNDWLAARIRERVAEFDECQLSVTYPHPHPRDYDLSRFTGVEPFDRADWDRRKKTVTFITRTDRLWAPRPGSARLPARVLGRLFDAVGEPGHSAGQCIQRWRITRFASKLREKQPDVDVRIAGIGRDRSYPSWITDHRVEQPTIEQERTLCERYAESHVVVGVHGSSMLLPSGHAGAVVELIPNQRLGNVVQDFLFHGEQDRREALLDYRLLPLETSVQTLAHTVGTILRDFDKLRGQMTVDGDSPGASRANAASRE